MSDLNCEYLEHRDIEQLNNQLEKLAKHYPRTKNYADRLLIGTLKDLGSYERAWTTTRTKKLSISLIDVFQFEKFLGRGLFDGELMVQINGCSNLTEFGERNIGEIQQIAGRFLDIFFTGIITDEYRSPVLISHKSEYYEQFYFSEAEFQYWKELDDRQMKQGYKRNIAHVPKNAIFSLFSHFLTDAEKTYRTNLGLPQIGEGWISETELYYKIKKQFEDIEVEQHARPKWLGLQSLDIYIPSINLGIEYQGAQHFKPVDWFGGQAGLEKNMMRDRRKLQLAEVNGCSMIYVYPGYQFEEVQFAIEGFIASKRLNFEARHINRPKEAEDYLAEMGL
jgi:hypothetical protein